MDIVCAPTMCMLRGQVRLSFEITTPDIDECVLPALFERRVRLSSLLGSSSAAGVCAHLSISHSINLYIHIYTNIHTNIHTLIHAYMHTHIHTCIHAYLVYTICVYIQSYACH